MQNNYPDTASDQAPLFPEPALTREQLEHFAYLQGVQEGQENKLAKAGLMAFGLTCAISAVDAENTRLWLAGFRKGQIWLHQGKGADPDVLCPAE